MIIDAYSHMFNSQFAERLAEAGGEWAKGRVDYAFSIAARKPQFTDLALRLELLERNEIAFQVVTPQQTYDCNMAPGEAPVKLAYARAMNESMAALAEQSKGKLLAVGTVPLADFERDGQREMERMVRSLGLKGVIMVSNINGKPVDLPEFEPFWARAAEMDIPVYLHPYSPVSSEGRSYEGQYDLMHNFGWPFETILALSRLVFSGIMERYPKLKVVSHHLGGGMPFFMGRTEESYARENQKRLIGQVLPKSLAEYYSSFYYDTAIGGSAPAIRCAYEVFGADQLVFATDSPFGPGKGEGRLAEYPGVIKSLGLPGEDEEKILSGNIKRILGL